MPGDRYDRQVLLFGEEGQVRIERTRVAIVGLGGLGSHVVQLLAYLGVCSFDLIDKDVVAETNLNRLVGAGPTDADAARLKVIVGQELVRKINPEAQVRLVPESFISEEGFEAIRRSDWVFGCVDRDGARLILTELCAAYECPYLDVATEVAEDASWYGGRLFLSRDGKGCLSCAGKLNQDELQDDFSTAEQRADRRKAYGLPEEIAARRSPSIVSINGVVASLAVTEFMAGVTGLRPARTSLEYRADLGTVRVDADRPSPDCFYCSEVRGLKGQADLERFIRDGWGTRL